MSLNKDNKNSVTMTILNKLKNELLKEDIKTELNNSILQPLYTNAYDKIFPHYITVIVLLIIIIYLVPN